MPVHALQRPLVLSGNLDDGEVQSSSYRNCSRRKRGRDLLVCHLGEQKVVWQFNLVLRGIKAEHGAIGYRAYFIRKQHAFKSIAVRVSYAMVEHVCPVRKNIRRHNLGEDEPIKT